MRSLTNRRMTAFASLTNTLCKEFSSLSYDFRVSLFQPMEMKILSGLTRTKHDDFLHT
jgi:hypothetical protein